MDRIMFFLTLSLPILLISRKTIFKLNSHGFYRLISWECIAWLFASNYKYWFEHPFSANQIISWVLLIISGYLVIAGAILMRKYGKPKNTRKEENLYKFEKTTELIKEGIFKYIRHPLYSSLLFLTWGIFFKNLSIELLFVSILSTICLYLTAIFEEKECLVYFGNIYTDYMQTNKRFVPFIV